MAFDPTSEPCHLCGREADECVCGFAADLPDDFDPLDEYDDDSYLYGDEEDDDDDS